MIELKYNSYDELPISKYLEVKEVLNNADEEDKFTTEIELISLLCGMSVDELMEKNVQELQGITNKCAFLAEPVIASDKIDKVNVNGTEYVVCTNLKDFSVAQYVDFQNYPKDEQHMAENLSTFVVPKGKKYGEDYDIADTIKDFNEHMPTGTAISLQNFFIKKLVDCTKDTLRSLIPLMKREVKKTKSKKKEETLKRLQEMEEHMYGFRW